NHPAARAQGTLSTQPLAIHTFPPFLTLSPAPTHHTGINTMESTVAYAGHRRQLNPEIVSDTQQRLAALTSSTLQSHTNFTQALDALSDAELFLSSITELSAPFAEYYLVAARQNALATASAFYPTQAVFQQAVKQMRRFVVEALNTLPDHYTEKESLRGKWAWVVKTAEGGNQYVADKMYGMSVRCARFSTLRQGRGWVGGEVSQDMIEVHGDELGAVQYSEVLPEGQANIYHDQEGISQYAEMVDQNDGGLFQDGLDLPRGQIRSDWVSEEDRSQGIPQGRLSEGMEKSAIWIGCLRERGKVWKLEVDQQLRIMHDVLYVMGSEDEHDRPYGYV
ncbi:hypothetical protein P154DRAFT_599114, partial [Amniculicola lignicola CBS 123094]